MKKIIFCFIVMAMSVLANVANAEMDVYTGAGWIFPDEKTTQGLPDSFPCAMNGGNLGCTWLLYNRKIYQTSAQGQTTWYNNQNTGRCIRGKCMYGDGSGQAGVWPAEVPFTLSVWYVIGESTDGKVVAYRQDKSPWVSADYAVSYAQAGANLKEFYEAAGMADVSIQKMFAGKYAGGWKQFLTDQGGAKPTAVASTGSTAVFEAHCAPQMDDSCTVNNVKVAKADLGNHLPVVKDTDVEAKGGYCEYPICYNTQDKPIGIRE